MPEKETVIVCSATAILVLILIYFTIVTKNVECLDIDNSSMSVQLEKKPFGKYQDNEACMLYIPDFGKCDLLLNPAECEIPNFNSTWAINIFSNLVSPCEPC